jgi:hypothetical protein
MNSFKFILIFVGTFLVPIDIRVSSYNSNLDVGHDVSGSSLEVPLTPSYYSDSSSYTETNIDSNNTENVIPKFAEELKKSAKSIPLTHKYMTAHCIGLVQAFQ